MSNARKKKEEHRDPKGTSQEEQRLIPIYIMGKRYMVPDSLTIQKAMEYAGYQLVRGCGCRGGICGACGTVYRFPDSPKIEVGLACQTVVQPNMYLTQIPFFPANKAEYNLDELEPTAEQVIELYPEILKCMGCNTCTKSCPMDIEVMEYISAALRGDIAEAADLSFDCVMCGLCTARCPAEIGQYNIGILCRRLKGKYLVPKAQHLQEVLKKLEAGDYEEGLGELMQTDKDSLKKLYVEREIEPAESEDDWEPKEHNYL
ncbi:MAG: 4Fe-4S dicluster domain-containing protein [Deltaproteobacteria bacterium]|nr:4Fe-4S dicluster domain-containing protein [Deltaproteobacteria bacterium]